MNKYDTICQLIDIENKRAELRSAVVKTYSTECGGRFETILDHTKGDDPCKLSALLCSNPSSCAGWKQWSDLVGLVDKWNRSIIESLPDSL